MIKNLEHLLPTLSTEEIYFYLGYYHGRLSILNNVATSHKYFDKQELNEIIGAVTDDEKEKEADF